MDVSCPHCGTKYEVTEQECGQKALCEVCNNKFIIGKGQPNISAVQDDAEEMKIVKCPHCGTEYDVAISEIGKSAQCEACGKDFVVSTTQSPITTAMQTSPRRKHSVKNKYKIEKALSNYAVASTPNYAENQKYFSETNAKGGVNAAKLGCGTSIIIFFWSFLIASQSRSDPSGIIFFIALFMGCIVGVAYYIIAKNGVSDADIDNQARAMGNGLEDKALNKLGIDLEEVSLIKPVKFWGYRFVWPSLLGDGANIKAIWKLGQDNIYRSSEVTHTIFYFGEHSVYCYERTSSLVSGAYRDTTEEYFYRDIVSVKTDFKTTVGGKCSVTTNLFILTNTGGERRECEIVSPVEADAAVKAFRTLLKQKKL